MLKVCEGKPHFPIGEPMTASGNKTEKLLWCLHYNWYYYYCLQPESFQGILLHSMPTNQQISLTQYHCCWH